MSAVCIDIVSSDSASSPSLVVLAGVSPEPLLVLSLPHASSIRRPIEARRDCIR